MLVVSRSTGNIQITQAKQYPRLTTLILTNEASTKMKQNWAPKRSDQTPDRGGFHHSSIYNRVKQQQ